MTIEEYYKNYKKTKKYPIKLFDGNDKTIGDFFNNFIRKHLLPVENVLAWHNMLIEYIDRQDAIYWVRYYESGSKKNNRWNTRRGCLTKFSDDFKYVFVSNFDAHEILNMIRLGVTPDVDMFAKMMNDFSFPMHYDPRGSCEESDICAYPNIGTPRGGVLTTVHSYLAHIYGIKSEFLMLDGRNLKLNKKAISKIYPRGVISDWDFEKGCNRKIRRLNYSLTDEEKELVKAHFLRFVDPLNYYVTPGPKCETNLREIRIGEFEKLNDYLILRFEEIYGLESVSEFRYRALLERTPIYNTEKEIVDISYGLSQKKPCSTSYSQNSSINQEQNEKEYSRKKNHDDENIEMIIEYLSNPSTSFRKLEVQFLGIDSQARGGGYVSRGIINSAGFDKNDKGVLTKLGLNQLILSAVGERLITLKRIRVFFDDNE